MAHHILNRIQFFFLLFELQILHSQNSFRNNCNKRREIKERKLISYHEFRKRDQNSHIKIDRRLDSSNLNRNDNSKVFCKTFFVEKNPQNKLYQ